MTKQTPKSCSCSQCKRGKHSKAGKISMKKDERAFRHGQKIALKKSSGNYDAAPCGGYYD
jgi:hypothetical protein